MSDSEGKGILFLQLVVLFKVKKKKRRKRKKWERELFRKREEKCEKEKCVNTKSETSRLGVFFLGKI